MDFKNWFLLLSVLGIIGFSAYYISQNSYPIDNLTRESPTVTPEVAGSSRERPASWKEFNGETLKFYHPEEWVPEKRDPFGGAIVEDIALNIPDSIDNSISYSVTSFDLLKPEDIVKEEELILNDRKWTKWVREGEGYASYDFNTKENLNQDDAESFGVHVTVKEKNEKLEEELLVLVNSIELGNMEATSSPTASPTAEMDLP